MNKITKEQIVITGIDRRELYDVEWSYILNNINEFKKQEGCINFNKFITRHIYLNTYYEWKVEQNNNYYNSLKKILKIYWHKIYRN